MSRLRKAWEARPKWSGSGNKEIKDGNVSPLSLRNVPPEPRIVLKKFWVNTFPVNLGYVPGIHRDRYDADRENECCRGSRIACTEIEVPVPVEDEPKTVKREGWVNVYAPNCGGHVASLGPAYLSKDLADLADEAAKQKISRIDCVLITWEDHRYD